MQSVAKNCLKVQHKAEKNWPVLGISQKYWLRVNFSFGHSVLPIATVVTMYQIVTVTIATAIETTLQKEIVLENAVQVTQTGFYNIISMFPSTFLRFFCCCYQSSKFAHNHFHNIFIYHSPSGGSYLYNSLASKLI